MRCTRSRPGSSPASPIAIDPGERAVPPRAGRGYAVARLWRPALVVRRCARFPRSRRCCSGSTAGSGTLPHVDRGRRLPPARSLLQARPPRRTSTATGSSRCRSSRALLAIARGGRGSKSALVTRLVPCLRARQGIGSESASVPTASLFVLLDAALFQRSWSRAAAIPLLVPRLGGRLPLTARAHPLACALRDWRVCGGPRVLALAAARRRRRASGREATPIARVRHQRARARSGATRASRPDRERERPQRLAHVVGDRRPRTRDVFYNGLSQPCRRIGRPALRRGRAARRPASCR